MYFALLLPLVTSAAHQQPVNPQKGFDPKVEHVDQLKLNKTRAGVSVYGPYMSYQVNVDEAGMNTVGDAANEPSMAISTIDKNNIVVGYRQFDSAFDTYKYIYAGAAYSTDGGVTWKACSGGGKIGIGVSRSDPVLAYDSKTQRFLYNSYDPLIETDIFASAKGDVWASADPAKALTNALGGDKQWMAADNNPSSPGYGRVYQVCDIDVSAFGGRQFNFSPDGGTTWSQEEFLPHGPTFACVSVLENGSVCVAGSTTEGFDPGSRLGKWKPDEIWFLRSDDAAYAGAPSADSVFSPPSRFIPTSCLSGAPSELRFAQPCGFHRPPSRGREVGCSGVATSAAGPGSLSRFSGPEVSGFHRSEFPFSPFSDATGELLPLAPSPPGFATSAALGCETCRKRGNSRDGATRQRSGSTTWNVRTRVDMGGAMDGFSAINPDSATGMMWVGGKIRQVSNPPKASDADNAEVYMLCSIRRGPENPADVMFVRSTDGGRHFGPPQRINDDPEGQGAFHWFASLGVAPNGRLDALWYDTRVNPGVNRLSQLYYSSSSDGGKTWSINVAVSAPFDPTIGYVDYRRKFGDYMHVVSLDDSVNVAYAGTFLGGEDIWFLRFKPGV